MLHSHINFTPSLKCILLHIHSTNFHRYRTLKILWIYSILWYQMLGIKLVDVLTRMYCFCYYYENTPYNLIHSHPVLQATCEIICEAHVALKGIRSHTTGITTLKLNTIQSLDNLEVHWTELSSPLADNRPLEYSTVHHFASTMHHYSIIIQISSYFKLFSLSTEGC